MSLTKVNTWGLVYEWPGSDKSLKPILLTAHQGMVATLSVDSGDPSLVDVVPVNPKTVNEWEYPPYSGHYDGRPFFKRGDVIPMTSFRRGHMGPWQF